MDKLQLTKFLLAANKPHAFGTAKLISETDGSRTIKFSQGKYLMHDNFFGGEPYGGRQVIFNDNQPVWMCLYYGQVDEKANAHEVYDLLRAALQHPDPDKPYRGPDSFSLGEYTYKNEVKGDIANFEGVEVILYKGKTVYDAKYMGGMIDQRNKGSY